MVNDNPHLTLPRTGGIKRTLDRATDFTTRAPAVHTQPVAWTGLSSRWHIGGLLQVGGVRNRATNFATCISAGFAGPQPERPVPPTRGCCSRVLSDPKPS